LGKSKKNIFHILIFLFLFSSSFYSCRSAKQKQSRKHSRHHSSKSKKTEAKKITKKDDEESSAPTLKGKAATDKVIKTAKSYLGTPYQYGGSSKRGTDCSGLACQAYKSIGVSLPRVAGDQADVGERISIDDLKSGDLVFFGAKKGSRKITHVGIVTNVKSSHEILFIHASTSKGVIESNLFSEYYHKIYIKSSRPDVN